MNDQSEPEASNQLADLHMQLREAILDGQFATGESFSQVKLSTLFGVSRTPLREALRMLESEGLVESLPNRQTRVKAISVGDLDGLYGLRIATESLAIRMSVPRLTDDDVGAIRTCHATLADPGDVDPDGVWNEAHDRFHRLLLSRAGQRLTEVCSRGADHSRPYRREFLARSRSSFTTTVDDHRTLLHFASLRDGHGAARVLARHLAQTSLSLIAAMQPIHDAVMTRSALSIVEASAPHRGDA